MSYNTIQDVMKDSIRIDEGMISIFPQFGFNEVVIPQAPKFNDAVYCMNNSTVAYIIEGTMYVTPFTRSKFEIIHETCREVTFHVPFSNWDYPKQVQDQWKQLLIAADQARENEFIADCKHWCDENRIGELPNEVLDKCFKIPVDGVDVTYLHYRDRTVPIIHSVCLDYTVKNLLGKFCMNNGRVVFVYRDSSTYVCKGYRIIDILRQNGYTESGLFVPFSNGEVIDDPLLRAKWEGLERI